ncbi:hypothetical protein JYQ62_19715 [Nostoc sp. UHCC 0702]|nr:hypothetical protein JYQ62_19715 [Nostoc sp. UHCC 0702]
MYWLALYTVVFSGAVVLSRLTLIFKPHLFLLFTAFCLALYGWWHWQKHYGEINPTSKEIWLKAGALLVAVVGYGAGIFR